MQKRLKGSETPLKLIVLHKGVQELRILPVTDILPNHLLVQPGVFPEPLSYLVVVRGAAEEALLLQELDPLLRLLVELLRASDQQLGETAEQ